MTFDPPARAREIAQEIEFYDEDGNPVPYIQAIESALLQFAREVLTQEPDEGMLLAQLGCWTYENKGLEGCALDIWKAMATVRAKSLEDAK